MDWDVVDLGNCGFGKLWVWDIVGWDVVNCQIVGWEIVWLEYCGRGWDIVGVGGDVVGLWFGKLWVGKLWG